MSKTICTIKHLSNFNVPSKKLLIVSLLATACIDTTAFAVEKTTIKTAKAMETVTVTASKMPIDLIRSGSSVTILTSDQIRQSQARSVADLLRSVAGLQVNQQGSKGAVTQIRVRGAEANQLLVLIDGVEANDIAQGSEFNFTHLMTSQINRIEIVRGPQSALWGSDALAGVINIITTGNNNTGSSVNINAELGSENSQQAGIGWQFKNDQAQLQLSLNHYETDGTNISRAGNEDDGYRNSTIAINTQFKLNDNYKLTAMLRHTNTTTEFDSIDFISTGLPVDANNETDATQLYRRINLEINSFDSLYTQNFSIALTDTDNENDTGGAINSISRGTKTQYQYQGDLVINNQSLSIIAEYEDEAYQQRGQAFSFGDPNKNLDLQNQSFAMEYRFNGDDWTLSASARIDDNSDFDSNNTYRLTANWQTPIDKLYAFASIGKAAKNPTFTERFGFFDNFIGNPNLEPETSDSWELGLRHSFREATLTSSISYFRSQLENEINGFVFDANTGGFTAANRPEDSDRQGFEVEMRWLPVSELTFSASYTYLDSTFDNSNGHALDEVRRPRHIGSIIANYAWQKLNVNLAVNYNGRQIDDFFPPFPASQTRVRLSSYTLVNLAASYPVNEHLQVFLRIENAFDDNYEEVFGFQAPGSSAYAGLKITL